MRGLDSWGAGHRTGRQLHLQICLLQVDQYDSGEDLFIPAWKNGQSMTQRAAAAAAADDDDDDDMHRSITGRYMFYPSTPPLCVNVTLNYLVVSK